MDFLNVFGLFSVMAMLIFYARWKIAVRGTLLGFAVASRARVGLMGSCRRLAVRAGRGYLGIRRGHAAGGSGPPLRF